MLSVTAATVHDWPYPAKGGMDNLVAMWVAFAYANGHLFIVPNNVWCYSDEVGAHAYHGPEKVFLPLYRFIRQNERLLDGYDPVEQVGLAYRPGGAVNLNEESGGASGGPKRKWVDPFSETCGELVEAHYPFGVLFPGRGDSQHEFSKLNLERFERVVIPEGVQFKGEEKAIVETWKRQGRAVPWTGPEASLHGLEPMIRVADGNRIWVFPRRSTKDPLAPFVCHLFNPCYDAERDRMIEQTNVVINIRTDLLSHSLQKAVLYTPYEEQQTLPVRSTGGSIEICVPKLALWGILTLE
jgi:hypothetical protein